MRVGAKYRYRMRFDSGPYLSATHGNRYVKKYANRIGKVHGSLEQGLRFSAGTILVKDSFTVTNGNEVFRGALFVMKNSLRKKTPKPPTGATSAYVPMVPRSATAKVSYRIGFDTAINATNRGLTAISYSVSEIARRPIEIGLRLQRIRAFHLSPFSEIIPFLRMIKAAHFT